jgi:hypothetical protein
MSTSSARSRLFSFIKVHRMVSREAHGYPMAKSKSRQQQRIRVSDDKRERDRLLLKEEMLRWYRLRIGQFLEPDDARMAAYRTAGLASELGTARRGKGTVWDWLAAHGDRARAGWRMVTYPHIEVRTAALPHLREALDNEERLARALVRLHQQSPTLSLIVHLTCFDSPWSEHDVARAFNDGGARSGWTRENVTKRKSKGCLWLRAWTDPRLLPQRKDGERAEAHGAGEEHATAS